MKLYYRFRWRRAKRLWWRRAQTAYKWLRKLLRAFGWRRSRRLRLVQRFLIIWGAVFGLALGGLFSQFKALEPYYLQELPTSGGTYVEGVVGKFGSFNPLFAETGPAEAVSRLIFSGLAKYDGDGRLVPDLAASWQVNTDATLYTVALKPNLLWHDGQPLTAADVAFTIQTIQNPDVHSNLASTWAGTKVEVVDDLTVRFSLPTPYAPFLNLLTVGIVPSHILSLANPSDLKVINFNQQPVGSGPFAFDHLSFDQRELHLRANNNYSGGAPRLRRLVVKTYDDFDALARAIRGREVGGGGGYNAYHAEDFSLTAKAKSYQWSQTSQMFAFLNTQRGALAEQGVRQALVQATDSHEIAILLGEEFSAAKSALLPEHLGYSSEITQLPFNLEAAQKALTAAGWIEKDGTRQKGDQTLTLEMVAQNSGVYADLAKLLQRYWSQLGVVVNLSLEPVEKLQQDYIPKRSYDVILFEIALGADPDVYAYWHSSQADESGLNLARYKSKVADEALEAGRTRVDADVRAAKYRTFLQTWRQDAPAIALLRSSYMYTTRGLLELEVERLISPTDRFYNVSNWAVKTEPKLRRLVE